MIESSPMNRFVSTAIPLGFVLAACGNPPSVAPPADHAAVLSANESSSKIPMRGVVATLGAVTTFRECGAPGGAAMSLADDGGALAKAFASLEAKPADGIYVELDGTPAIDGKAIALTRLLRARALGNTAACDTPVFEGEFVASGNEPFWAIEIREGGIVYRDPAIPKGRIYPYAFTRTETGTVVYATKLEKPKVSTLEVALEPAACLDSMSGELHSFRAHVVLDGRKLEGCALAGVPRGEFGNSPLDELNRFAGAYPHTAQLFKDPALSKRLETLLGTSMNAFLENMKVQGPLMKDNGVFYVTGNRPHQGGLDNAFFLADPASDTIAVILFVNGSRRDFKEGGREVELPAEVVTTIGNMETP
jgi:uncharacterized membrane protein